MRKSLLLLATIVSLCVPSTLAAQGWIGDETISLARGDVLEIIGSEKNAVYSWMLEKDGNFKEASRNHIFQTRLKDVGMHTLKVQMQTFNGTVFSRSITVDVTPAESQQPPQGSAQIVQTVPSLSNETVVLDPRKKLLRISPVRSDLNAIAIDLDIRTDSNGDTKTANDDDTKQTVFRSGVSDIFVLFTEEVVAKTLRIGARTQGGELLAQDISVQTSYTPPPPVEVIEQPTVVNPQPIREGVYIDAQPQQDRSIAFAVAGLNNSSPLLYEWSFGDGTQSLLDTPIHTFTESKTYTVSVRILDINTGRVVDEVTENIEVDFSGLDGNSGTTEPTTPTEPEKDMEDNADEDRKTETETENEDEDNSGSGGGMLKLILIIGAVLLVSIIIGVLLLFIIKKILGRSSMDKKFEEMEQAMTEEQSGVPDINAPPVHLEMNTEVQQSEVVETSVNNTVTTEESTAADPYAAQPIQETQEAEVVSSTPTVEQPPQDAWQPEVVDTPVETVQTQTQPATETPTPEPTPTPAVAEPVETFNEPEQSAPVKHDEFHPDTHELRSDPNNAPDWLQGGLNEAAAEGQTPDSPLPEELKPPAPVTPPPPPVEPAPAEPEPPVESPAVETPSVEPQQNTDSVPTQDTATAETVTQAPVTNTPAETIDTDMPEEAPLQAEEDWMSTTTTTESQSSTTTTTQQTETTTQATESTVAESDGAMPDWLQETPTPAPTKADTIEPAPVVNDVKTEERQQKAPEEVIQEPTPAEPVEEPDTETDQTTNNSSVTPSGDEGQAPDTEPVPEPAPVADNNEPKKDEDLSEEERKKRERKRAKRQRYRENLKKRKANGNGNGNSEPTAVPNEVQEEVISSEPEFDAIAAEPIEQTPPTPEPQPAQMTDIPPAQPVTETPPVQDDATEPVAQPVSEVTPADNEPVAFVQAEDVSQTQTPQETPQSPTGTSEPENTEKKAEEGPLPDWLQ